MSKQFFEQKVLEGIPRILCLLDKNPLSTSYGCLDRKYWQYKILDFPSGMQQELVLPLAYVWSQPFEGNKYYGNKRLREFIDAILGFHALAIHPDGSMDDYFPHERAFGATAYALASLTEAALMLGSPVHGPTIEALRKSGEFLASYQETGVLANHHAIASAALCNLYSLTGENCWLEASDRLVDHLAELQHAEGWFPEYEGCDLGYQTVTLEFLARRQVRKEHPRLQLMLDRLLDFLVDFSHPDGSLGGEYGSRNTYNFYPGGFALLSASNDNAARILGRFFLGHRTGAANCLEDDGVFGHFLSSYIVALCAGELQTRKWDDLDEPSLVLYEGAGLFRGQAGRYSLFGNTTKGGVLKVFKDDALMHSDTGLAGRLADGTRFCQNKPGVSSGMVEGMTVSVKGDVSLYSSNRLSRLQMAGLRILSLSIGPWRGYSNWIRSLMQKILIYKKTGLGLEFERTVELSDEGVRVVDKLVGDERSNVRTLYRSTDCVNTHVVTSDGFQAANLLSWCELKPVSDDEFMLMVK